MREGGRWGGGEEAGRERERVLLCYLFGGLHCFEILGFMEAQADVPADVSATSSIMETLSKFVVVACKHIQ
jgi:hypothetical protein